MNSQSNTEAKDAEKWLLEQCDGYKPADFVWKDVVRMLKEYAALSQPSSTIQEGEVVKTNLITIMNYRVAFAEYYQQHNYRAMFDIFKDGILPLAGEALRALTVPSSLLNDDVVKMIVDYLEEEIRTTAKDVKWFLTLKVLPKIKELQLQSKQGEESKTTNDPILLLSDKVKQEIVDYCYEFAWHYGRLWHFGDAERIKAAISEKFKLPEEWLLQPLPSNQDSKQK